MLYGRYYNTTPTSTVTAPSPKWGGSTAMTNPTNVRDEGVVDGTATTYALGVVDGSIEDFQSIQVHSPTTGPQGWWAGVVVDLDITSQSGAGEVALTFDHADVNAIVHLTSTPGRAQYLVDLRGRGFPNAKPISTSVDFPVSIVASWNGGGSIVVRVYEVQYIYLPRGEIAVQEG